MTNIEAQNKMKNGRRKGMNEENLQKEKKKNNRHK